MLARSEFGFKALNRALFLRQHLRERPIGEHLAAIWRHAFPRFALALAYLLVAAAAFNGFYTKRGFQDDSRYVSAAKIMDGSAIRPFVFRRLDVEIVDAAMDILPSRLQETGWRHYVHDGRSSIGPDAATVSDPHFFVAYTFLYYLVFTQFFASLFVLRAIFSRFVGPLAATITPALWALLMPVIQAVSAGFFYDYSELLFLSCAVLAAMDGRIGLLALWTIAGTLNKETFLVFIPTLIPFLAPILRPIRTAALVLCLMAGSAFLYVYTKQAYSGNGGFDADSNVLANLRFYPNPLNLFKVEKVYGLPLPRAWSLFWVTTEAAIIAASWDKADQRLKRHILLALVINLPLFLLFGAPGEVRNMSLCFVGAAALLAYALDGWIERFGEEQQNFDCCREIETPSGPSSQMMHIKL